MGAVFEVENTSNGRHFALKTVHPHLLLSRAALDRFEVEVRASVQVDHVVNAVDTGVDEVTNTPWLLLELLQGHTLEDEVKTRGALAPLEAHWILEQLGAALVAAHTAHAQRGGAPGPEAVERIPGDDADGVACTGGEGARLRPGALHRREQDGGGPHLAVRHAGVDGTRAVRGGAGTPRNGRVGLRAHRVLRADGSLLLEERERVGLAVQVRGGARGGHRQTHPERERACAGNSRSNVSLPPGFDAWLTRCLQREEGDRFGARWSVYPRCSRCCPRRAHRLPPPDQLSPRGATAVGAPSVPKDLAPVVLPPVKTPLPPSAPLGQRTELMRGGPSTPAPAPPHKKSLVVPTCAR